jgi:hypothetical protein
VCISDEENRDRIEITVRTPIVGDVGRPDEDCVYNAASSAVRRALAADKQRDTESG